MDTTVSAGLKVGEKFLEATAIIASKFPDAPLRVKKEVKEMWDIAQLKKRAFVDYAKSFDGKYPDVLLGLSSAWHEAEADYQNSIVLFAKEIEGVKNESA